MKDRRLKLVAASIALVAAGAFGVYLFSGQPPSAISSPRSTRLPLDSRSSGRSVDRTSDRAATDRARADLDQRIQLLTGKLAEESSKRQRLEDQVENLSEQLAALHAHVTQSGENPHPRQANDTRAPSQVRAAHDDASNAQALSNTASPMERALVAAGIDASTAAELKHRRDELTMREMYLRDQATREGWLDSPHFTQEMAAIDAQRTSIRDDIGDDAYDRYLFAQGESNRVRIEDVMSESAAAEAGLQAGDIVLRYGDARIFGPQDLVNETRSGTAGESTQLQIMRNGQLLQLNVPRGPLGLRIAATQAEPSS